MSSPYWILQNSVYWPGFDTFFIEPAKELEQKNINKTMEVGLDFLVLGVQGVSNDWW